MLANCQENSYGEQQKTWQTEIREKLQTSINNSSKIHEHEQDLIRKRQEEWKHAKDVRLIYERKLQRTNDLYNELSVCFAQLEEREREIAEREKQIGTNKPYKKAITQLRKQHFDKISRRRLHIATQFTQANSTNSPSPPSPSSPLKTSLYVQLDGNQTKSVVNPTGFRCSKKTRHRRVGSGSSMNVKNITNRDRKQYDTENRNASLVDTQTQTDTKDVEKNETTSSEPSEVTVKKNEESSESSDSDIDDNVPQEDTTSSSQTNNNQTMANSMATSIMTGSNLSYDTEDMSEKHRAVASDDDNLESLRRKVNELIIETTSNIDSYSTNSSTNTIINRNFTRFHSKTCEKANGFSCTNKEIELPNGGFMDKNENLQDIKCSCTDGDENGVDNSIDGDVKSCSEDEEFDGPKKFNYSLRMKR